ncbi:hypothetical protein E4U11_002807 [Claviceps purpurea]|nr:hypothetical protein E4U11_002807 [Claviceps purpurea]
MVSILMDTHHVTCTCRWEPTASSQSPSRNWMEMSLSHIAIPDGDVVRARRDPESTHRSEPRLKASMSVQPGETTTVVVSHNLPTHDRVLLEPKKTTALGIYAAVTDDATGHVVVHNPGTRVVAIQQNQCTVWRSGGAKGYI